MDYPIIFIPGLFGSMGDDVIRGTGEFSFGFAEKVYRPFIELLNSMGYVEGVDLFISYYDWKRTVLESVGKYLYPDIERAKLETGSEKVILIGHSLGGLLGRGYLKYFIPSNIDKLIMIGTPNLGAVDAYYFWSGGKLPYSRVEDNILYNGLKLGFMIYANLFHNLGYMEVWRRMFPVAEDLLPSYGYGNYLFWEKNGVRKEVPIEKMSIGNTFLNRLSNEDGEKVFIIGGKGIFTNKEFEIKEHRGMGKKWRDGEPIRAYRTNYGDGTVIAKSTLGGLRGNSILIEGNHIDILYKSKDHLSTILNRPVIKEIRRERVEKVDLIFIQDCEDINICTYDDNRISGTRMDIVDSRVQAMNIGEDGYWIMITGDRELEVEVEAKSSKRNGAIIHRRTIGLNSWQED
ncbi:MAG: alpha/beta fold hydrolase [Tissierellia bacterium]|nr:alpha/beta fold hydrolase [Tissierellia bacterium]